MAAVEGKASSGCQVYPLCPITSEVGAEFWRAWGAEFEQEGAGEAGGGGGGPGGATPCINKTRKDVVPLVKSANKGKWAFGSFFIIYIP